MGDAKTKKDEAVSPRLAALREEHETRRAEFEAQLAREEAMASVPQKVVDANEHAALLSLTGQRPERDLSDAPPPGLLGPHSETVNPVADPADVDTSTAGNEGDAES